MESKTKVVSVIGPTASGKTKLSVELAKHFNGEIISADSMQIYKDMQIATAKPTEEEKDGIVHHLMDFLPVDKTYSVAMFVDDAGRLITDITNRDKLPFVVGGTGLYVDSLLNNISFNENSRDEKICAELNEIYKLYGIEKLIDMLSTIDFESAEILKEQKNAKRIIRAIEFYKTNGYKISEQNKKSKLIESPYNVIKIGLACKDRQKLYDRINLRVDLMIKNGLLEETEQILKSNLSFTSIKAIGYKELVPYINNEKSLDACVEKLKQETRRYAKRQLTWFRRDADINWLYIDEYNSFMELYCDAVSIIERGL